MNSARVIVWTPTPDPSPQGGGELTGFVTSQSLR